MSAAAEIAASVRLARVPASMARRPLRQRRGRRGNVLHDMSMAEAHCALALLAAGAVPIRIKVLESLLGRPGHFAFCDLRNRVARSGLDLELVKVRWGYVLIGTAMALETLYVTASLRLGQEVLARAEDEQAGQVLADAGEKVGTGFSRKASEETICEPGTTKYLAGEKDAPLPTPLPDSGARGRSGAGGAA